MKKNSFNGFDRMHLEELAQLDRRLHGKPRVDSLKKLMLCTPHILDLVKHNDADLIDQLMQSYLAVLGIGSLQRYQAVIDFYNAASPTDKPWSMDSHFDTLKKITPNPSDLKDTYWHLLQKISDEAMKQDAQNVMAWVLAQLQSPLYPYFSKKESESRYRRRDKKFYSAWNNKDKRPLPRQCRDDLQYDAKRILIHGIEHLNFALVNQALPLVAQNQRRKKTQDKDTLYFHRALIIPEQYQNNVIGYLNDVECLLGQVDQELGTQASFKNYLTSKFIYGLMNNDDAVRAYFIDRLTKDLSAAEKKPLFCRVMLLITEQSRIVKPIGGISIYSLTKMPIFWIAF